MSEELKDFQTAPTLTLNPFAEEEKAQPEVKKEEPLMDENVLSEEERKMADQFANQIDLTNSAMILQYGAGTQSKMADFSETALENVKTKDLGEVGELLGNVVKELKNFDEEEEKGFFGKKGKIVPLNGQSQSVKMVISQPTTFEQSEEICSLLKEKKSVIVNLEYVNKDVARRIVDFISGGVYALDGHIQKISNSIFLIAPMNYEITNEMAREEIKNKLSVSWLKNNNIN